MRRGWSDGAAPACAGTPASANAVVMMAIAPMSRVGLCRCCMAFPVWWFS
ncbi:Uncharacterised protein [Bordetella pertussis]|nr:Uncharacterised protein [Bordetella pertussis]CFW07957.1 Uncharacterised protein [Bordetella pertussis]